MNEAGITNYSTVEEPIVEILNKVPALFELTLLMNDDDPVHILKQVPHHEEKIEKLRIGSMKM